ncbi:hypothetical protein [Pseudonocardia acaciae]|uniref:hypothetical protein n=1 Tax=Pseudonocardia acaciae TaxID=551276 RepID=UPI0012EDC5E1|nr:hypothetical protein [Pseudonocardia acaciae]
MNSPQPPQPEWTGQPAPDAWPQQQWQGAPGGPAGWQQQPYPAGWASGPETPVRMPGTVIAGLVMTYIGGGVMVLIGLVLLIGSANSEFSTAFASGLGAPREALSFVLVAVALFVLVFGAIVILPAVLANKGRNGGRIALTVIGGIAVALNLISLVVQGKLGGLLSTAWIAVAVGLLWTGRATAWFQYRARHRHPAG